LQPVHTLSFFVPLPELEPPTLELPLDEEDDDEFSWSYILPDETKPVVSLTYIACPDSLLTVYTCFTIPLLSQELQVPFPKQA
jgi:hypothetical protein